MLTWGWVKNWPSQLNGPSCEVSAFSIRSIASHSRSRSRIGFASPEAISVPPDFTKPICKRPFEITSSVAYSSATRTGSGRTVTSVPRLKILAFFVIRATIAVTSGLAPQRLLIPAWCSVVTMLMPRSSQSACSSNTSSNSLEAIFGSQYRFGKAARTESAWASTSLGTNGYGFSQWLQRSISASHSLPDIRDSRNGLLPRIPHPSPPTCISWQPGRAGQGRSVPRLVITRGGRVRVEARRDWPSPGAGGLGSKLAEIGRLKPAPTIRVRTSARRRTTRSLANRN